MTLKNCLFFTLICTKSTSLRRRWQSSSPSGANFSQAHVFDTSEFILDGQLVASCNLTIIPNLTRACRPYGLIENVVTHRAYRNRGFGKAVLARAVEVAWEQDCYKVMLMTGRKDEATLRFYQSAGFDPKGKQAFVAKPFT